MNVLARRLIEPRSDPKPWMPIQISLRETWAKTYNFKVANIITEWGLKTIATLKIHQITDTSSIAFLHKWPVSAAGIVEWCAQGHATKWWVAGLWSHLIRATVAEEILAPQARAAHNTHKIFVWRPISSDRCCDPQAPSLTQLKFSSLHPTLNTSPAQPKCLHYKLGNVEHQGSETLTTKIATSDWQTEYAQVENIISQYINIITSHKVDSNQSGPWRNRSRKLWLHNEMLRTDLRWQI